MQNSSGSVSHFRLSSLVLVLLNYNETKKISTVLDFNGQRKKAEIKQDLEFNIDDMKYFKSALFSTLLAHNFLHTFVDVQDPKVLGLRPSSGALLLFS